MASVAPGYSGKPLAAMLGFGEGTIWLVLSAQADYAAWQVPPPAGGASHTLGRRRALRTPITRGLTGWVWKPRVECDQGIR